MSRWPPEECGASPMRSDDRIFDRSKEWLSSEKREMLVHYFNHKAIAQQQQQEQVRHDSDVVTTRHHCYFSASSHPKREWLDAADNHQLVERRRHYSTGQDRPISTGPHESISCYHNDDDSQHLNSNQKNTRHYKSCNMIGSVMPAVHDSIDHQHYQARSVHQIPNSGYSNEIYSNNKKGNYSSPNLAISSQGLEYICNFKSTPRPHKISNQINGLMQTRSAQDLSIYGIHGNHHPSASSVGRSLSTAAGDHKSYKRRRKHKNCLLM